MSSGIYYIKNLINSKIYIGQSINIEARWEAHKKNEHNRYLKLSFEKYGMENFEFKIIEILNEDNINFMTEREQYYIDYFCSLKPSRGYNFKNAGPKGKLNEVSKRYISKKTKGKLKDGKPSALSRTGKHFTEERRNKISTALKGNKNGSVPCSKDKKIKISKSNFGKKRSEEAKQKMSLKKIGKTNKTKDTIWITNLESGVKKRIKEIDLNNYIKEGFIKGYFINKENHTS